MSLLKVSIIINNYNYAQFLEQAVESALAQTYPNCEVIVVDDGSADGSREVLNKFEGRATIILQENRGQVAALNNGLKRATGDLILFLDSDDVLFPEALEVVVKSWRTDSSKLQFPLEVLNSSGKPTGLLMPRARLSEGNILPCFLRTGRY